MEEFKAETKTPAWLRGVRNDLQQLLLGDGILDYKKILYSMNCW